MTLIVGMNIQSKNICEIDGVLVDYRGNVDYLVPVCETGCLEGAVDRCKESPGKITGGGKTGNVLQRIELLQENDASVGSFFLNKTGNGFQVGFKIRDERGSERLKFGLSRKCYVGIGGCACDDLYLFFICSIGDCFHNICYITIKCYTYFQ